MHMAALKMQSIYKFNCNDICDTIQQWVQNDINYTKQLKQIQHVFKENRLTGQKIIIADLTANNVKSMVENDLKALNHVIKIN